LIGDPVAAGATDPPTPPDADPDAAGAAFDELEPHPTANVTTAAATATTRTTGFQHN